MSKDNDQVFRKLRKLQKISIPSLSSPVFPDRDRRIPSIFPGLAPLDRRSDDATSSAILSPQNLEDFNHEPFDYGVDDEVEPPADLHATIAEVAVPQLEDDLILVNHSLQRDAPVHPTLEHGPSLASTSEQADISQADALTNSSCPQNGDLAIPPMFSLPMTLAHTVVNPLRPQSAGELDGDNTHLQNDLVLTDSSLRTPSTSSSSPALSYVYEEDPDAATQLSRILFDDDVPSTSLLTRPHLVDADVQSAATSFTNEAIIEDPIVDSVVSSTQSPSTSARLADRHDPSFDDEVPRSGLEGLEDGIDNLNEQYNIDTNIPATFILPFDIIHVTPPGSPILEGLSQYMVLHGSEAPGSVLRADQNNTLTPVQRTGERTLWPPSEVPRFGLLLSSANGQSLRSDLSSNPPESPEPNADIAIQPDLPRSPHLSHAQVRDLYLGMSISPFERIQSGLLRVIPTFFALDRETINGTASCPATGPRH